MDVHPLPIIDSIRGEFTICVANGSSTNELQTYRVTGLQGSTLIWTIGSGGDIVSGQGSDSLVVDWNETGTDSIKVTEVTQFSCIGPIISHLVVMDNPRISMQVVGDNFDNESEVEIKWNHQDFTGDYFVYKRICNSNDAWQWVGSTKKDSFVESNVPTDKNAFEYSVRLVNLCGEEITTLLPHNTILLTGSSNASEDKSSLSWNAYRNWSGTVTYEIWKKMDEHGSFTKVESISGLSAEYNDGREGLTHYYRIKAIESSGKISWSNTLKLDFDYPLEIPSAFTPNGDGKNEYWVIKNVDLYPRAAIMIFNRWGAKVYSSTNGYNNDWDGKNLPDGTYFYVIELNASGKKRLTGAVTIVR